MSELTPRQHEVLLLIKRYITREGYPPTIEEIRKGMGFKSQNAARDHVIALARRGAIKHTPKISRGITVL